MNTSACVAILAQSVAFLVFSGMASSSNVNPLLDWAKTRGGKRQREKCLQAIAEQDNPAPQQALSKLVTGLLEAWCTKELSATTVQQVASWAVQDGLQHPEVLKLAAIAVMVVIPKTVLQT